MRPGASPERLLAFLLAAYALVSAWDTSARPACIDYYQFWVVGRAVRLKESTDVYSAAERKRLGDVYWQRAVADSEARAPRATDGSARRAPAPITKRLQAANQRQELETFSTPWFYTVFGLFSGADYERSQDFFQRASLVAYAAAILLLARLLGFSLAAAALLLAALLQWFNPFLDDTMAGNVNRMQLLVVVAFLGLECRARFPGRHVVAGVLLGSLLAFKPNLAAIAAVALLGWAFAGELRRTVESVAGIAGGIFLSVLVSARFFGSLAPWGSWSSELPRLMAPGSPSAGDAREGNFSFARLLHDSAGITPGVALPLALLAATIVALVLERRRRVSGPVPANGDRPSRDVLLVGIGAVVSLLATELAWQHYFVAAVPLALVLLRPASGSLAKSTLALVALAMVSLQNVGRLFDLQKPAAGAAVVSAGTLLLFGLGLCSLARLRERSPA
jgi:hypothetical protein